MRQSWHIISSVMQEIDYQQEDDPSFTANVVKVASCKLPMRWTYLYLDRNGRLWIYDARPVDLGVKLRAVNPTKACAYFQLKDTAALKVQIALEVVFQLKDKLAKAVDKVEKLSNAVCLLAICTNRRDNL